MKVLSINDVFKIAVGNDTNQGSHHLAQLKDQYNKAKQDILKDLRIKF